MRIIDADALKTIKSIQSADFNSIETIRKWIDDAPTIDAVEVVHGEWIIHFDDLFPEESSMECSVCHEEQPLGIDDNYCPNCGADMRGASDAKSTKSL